MRGREQAWLYMLYVVQCECLMQVYAALGRGVASDPRALLHGVRHKGHAGLGSVTLG